MISVKYIHNKDRILFVGVQHPSEAVRPPIKLFHRIRAAKISRKKT